MKVLMKPIKMIALFEKNGLLTPIRYQFINESKENITICIDKVITKAEEKIAGNHMYIYKCKSIINKIEKIYELKYELNSCKWYLYKI